LNRVIELLQRKQPVFGLYAPSNPRPGGRGGAEPVKTAAQLAEAALSNTTADFLFDGSMEGNFERGMGTYGEFARAMAAASKASSPARRSRRPLVVKTPEIAPDPALAAERIARQLDLGTSGIVFVGVESAAEVRAGLDAMRFRSRGGTRPDDAVGAAASWGLSADRYREKADVWPLNPEGELIAWVIVESREGLARVREIAAVKGIGVLFPGAGTLRGVFTSTDANGQRVLDEAAWEASIQQVLAACKEFAVPCGYPATANDIEQRMKQGFSVFIMNWGDAGFAAIDIGRRVSGRAEGDGR
jgi:4-hydroxy-2-oxoheptanedioate aldolase